MKKLWCYIFLFLYSICLFSQGPIIVKPQNSQYYLNTLTNAKDSLYKSIILQFDAYLQQNPKDIGVCIEKCRLLEQAYYDYTEEYNPKEEEYNAFLDSLIKVFPNEPELLVYRTELTYGDSSIALINRIITDSEQNPERWKHIVFWKIYERLSNAYNSVDNNRMSIKYGLMAIRLNDTLDLSVTLAKQYQALKQDHKAIFILEKYLDSTNTSWELSQKGKLFLELGVFDKALIALKWANKDTSSSYTNNDDLADAMIENGLYEAARIYLVKDTEFEWNRSKSFGKLFEYDIKYSSGDSAAMSYRRMADSDFMNDPLGVKRLRLFLKSPLQLWTMQDILKLGLLLLAVVVIFLVPYLWILPIYTIGNFYIKKGRTYTQSPFRWTLRHFWLSSAGILLVNIFIYLIFDHDNFFGNTTQSIDDKVNLPLANMTLAIFICYSVVTFFLFKKTDIKLFFGNIWSKQKSIWTGIGYSLLLRVGVVMYLKIYNVLPFIDHTPSTYLNIIDNIVSVNKYYHPILGFLMVVIIVPIYEEILFRGIFLSASEKYMRFFWANTLQAVLFASLHLDLKLFPFYLAFGYIAGYQKRKSQALASGIVLHITNNLIAFLIILIYGSYLIR